MGMLAEVADDRATATSEHPYPVDARKLRSFVILAEEPHFSRAPARLGISQSTRSVRVQALEDELGVKLFDRSTRSVRLTEAGRRLMGEAGSVQRTLAVTAGAAQGIERSQAILRAGYSTVGRYGLTEHILDRYDATRPARRRSRCVRRPRAGSCVPVRAQLWTSASSTVGRRRQASPPSDLPPCARS